MQCTAISDQELRICSYSNALRLVSLLITKDSNAQYDVTQNYQQITYCVNDGESIDEPLKFSLLPLKGAFIDVKLLQLELTLELEHRNQGHQLPAADEDEGIK